ncbi:MAG: twin-arginine translocase subunit TatC [Phycisphaerae bacterium]
MAGPTREERKHPDDIRMTIGEHLDELRGCVVRSLIALVVACLVCIYPAQYLLKFMARPVMLALRAHGQADTLLATEPTEAFVLYVKVIIVSALVLASPYIIIQIWNFVAAGLYPAERRLAYRMVPISVLLFLSGVAFMYLFVLLASLNFLIGFSSWLPAPDPTPMPWETLFVPQHSTSMPASQSAVGDGPRVTVLASDPASPPIGSVWFNVTEYKLKFQNVDQVFSVQMTPDRSRPLVTTHLRIGEYLSFVLVLSIAFGLAFQVPLVVLFLVRSGIMTLEQLRAYRKMVIMLIVIVAAAIAPPDLLSHVLLSIPMILLFELGLLISRPRPNPERERAG